MAKRPISQPSLDDERELLALLDNESAAATLRGREVTIPTLTGHAQHKLTKILLSSGDEFAISCKCLAAARLNGYFSIKFLWPVVWRWYYYVRQYREDELADIVTIIKKKVPLGDYLANITSWIEMRETMMQMNREEVFRILQERSGGKGGNSAKSSNGSHGRSQSSE